MFLRKWFQVMSNLSKTSPKNCFKALYTRSSEQLFSQSTLYLTFYQQKFDKNAMFRHIVRSIDNSYPWDFLKVVVLKCSPKGAMCSSFRIAPCAWPSISKNLAEMQCLSILFQVLAKVTIKTFPKQLCQSAQWKEHYAAPGTLHIIFFQSEFGRNAIFG